MEIIRKYRGFMETVWIMLLITFVGHYFYENFDDIRESIALIGMQYLSLSILMLASGYLFVTITLWHSVIFVGAKIPFKRMIYINGVSQLAKYLPGSVWQYVSRVGYYRMDGSLGVKVTANAFTLEIIWMVSSSIIAATVFYMLYLNYTLLIVFCVVLVWWIFLWFINFRMTKHPSWQQTLIAQSTQFMIWVCFGLSFYALFAHVDLGFDKLPLVMAAFSISWAAGYVAFFAPGGLGVRELILVALLDDILSVETLLAYLIVHRLMMILVELLGVVIAKTHISTET